jgi:non-heme chloroperoxidase
MGAGRPVVLIHGWPLSGHSWEKQVPPLLEGHYRVITYDRRGFGWSSQPATGYNYDTLAADLNTLIEKLDLNDITLVGFSMGGGEVARYLAKYGSARVRQAVFVSAITPFLLKTDENPDGVDEKIFGDIQQGLSKDRPAFLAQFFKMFYNDHLLGKQISEEAMRASWSTAIQASAIATYACVDAWLEDFRNDLATISVPTLVVHGDADKVVPFKSSGKRMPDLIDDCRLVTIPDAPHGLNWTHSETLNQELVAFLKEPQRELASA